jgi:hypothetical protein
MTLKTVEGYALDRAGLREIGRLLRAAASVEIFVFSQVDLDLAKQAFTDARPSVRVVGMSSGPSRDAKAPVPDVALFLGPVPKESAADVRALAAGLGECGATVVAVSEEAFSPLRLGVDRYVRAEASRALREIAGAG